MIVERGNKSTIRDTTTAFPQNQTEVRSSSKMEQNFYRVGKRRKKINMKTKVQNQLKYAFFVVCAITSFSCQRNLTQFQASKDPKRIQNEIASDTLNQLSNRAEGKSIAIDTIKSSISNLGSLPTKESYYTQIVHQKIHSFYKTTTLQTKWLTDAGANKLFYALLEQLKNASYYGLRPGDYDVTRLEERVNAIYKTQDMQPSKIVDLDIHITEMFFLFATHLTEGKVRTAGYGNNIWIRQAKKSNDVAVSLLAAIKTPDQIASAIVELQPQHEQYVKLQKALEQYRALEQTTTLRTAPALLAKEKIKPEDRHVVIPFIRSKLSLTDRKIYAPSVDTITCTVDSLHYDIELANALKSFQAKCGLEPDGIIGEKTLKFLNQSFKEQADVIALNMERIKWQPESYGDNYILVNIPEFKLRVFENEEQALEMNVIVGATNKPTPIFNDMMEHIVFSPTWTVPNSIIKEEIIPRLKKDPAYYAQKNYSFYKNEAAIDPVNESWDGDAINPYQYRVVQQPGPDNSLGRVKFLLKNSMSVYLHDTPNHSLFSRSYRALSHGCVRLNEPARLAEYVLRDQKGWKMEKIQKSMNENNTFTIQLKKRYPVYIEYHTAWVDENNEINFREDIYGHDKQQLQLLYPMEKVSSTMAGL